jgi:hypothetical protein
MGEENNIPWWQKGFVGEQDPMSAFQPQNLNPKKLGGFSFSSIAPTPWQMPDSSNVINQNPLNPAENTAQGSEKESKKQIESRNNLVDAYSSIAGLNKLLSAKKPISSEGIGSSDLSKYSYVEKDIRGNIIGLTGRPVVDPYTGRTIGREAQNWKADTGGLGRPYTPGLDAFKAAQTGQVQEESEQSKVNRAAYIASKASQLPRGATATQTETPTGIQREVVGPSGYAKAMIPKKKKEGEVA